MTGHCSQQHHRRQDRHWAKDESHRSTLLSALLSHFLSDSTVKSRTLNFSPDAAADRPLRTISKVGGVAEDSVFYYRIHSPVLLVEFDHQAGQAFPQYKEHYKDHIHVIVRTPNGNDYGRDLLRQHYQRSRHHRV
ncbi:MAG TPA: DUF3500 domain-containing protein [Candidatus Binatia bacterium]|nr:DUF3500 domain-containing protein [Candidatus Binatia bacterium]